MRRRPGAVTFAVVLMYVSGIAQISLGVLTMFLRYAPVVVADGIGFAVTLAGAGMVLFGLFVIALASGVARGSATSRLGATTVMLMGLTVMVVDLLVANDGDWIGVVSQTVFAIAVTVPLWVGAGRRYFAFD